MREFIIADHLLNQDKPAAEYRRIHGSILNDLILQGKQTWNSRRKVDAVALDWHLRRWLEEQRCEYKLEITIGWAEFKNPVHGGVSEGYEVQIILTLPDPQGLLFKLAWGGQS